MDVEAPTTQTFPRDVLRPHHKRASRPRVQAACDECRGRKIKCDSVKPCLHCRTLNLPCRSAPKRRTRAHTYPKSAHRNVPLLESQQQSLVKGLRELYRRVNEDGDGRCQLQLTQKRPLTHDILAQLGVLEQPEEHEDSAGSQISLESTPSCRPPSSDITRQSVEGRLTDASSPSAELDLTTNDELPRWSERMDCSFGVGDVEEEYW